MVVSQAIRDKAIHLRKPPAKFQMACGCIQNDEALSTDNVCKVTCKACYRTWQFRDGCRKRGIHTEKQRREALSKVLQD